MFNSFFMQVSVLCINIFSNSSSDPICELLQSPGVIQGFQA